MLFNYIIFCHLRRCITKDCFRPLIISLIHTTLDFGDFFMVRLPAYQHLQSVHNAAARMVFSSAVMITSLTLLWRFIGCKYLNGLSLKLLWWLFVCCTVWLPYLNQLVCVANLTGHRRLCSSTSQLMQVSAHNCWQSFVSIIWNSLPLEVQSSDSTSVFRRRLKTHLLQISYPDIILL